MLPKQHAVEYILSEQAEIIYTDCYLRQGASGTEFARNGSRTCFLRWFYRRSQARFGQKLEEHSFSIKNVVWIPNWVFDEIPRWFCMVLHGDAQKKCSSSFWPKYAWERLCNHLNKQVLDPFRANSVPPAPCLKLQSEGSPHREPQKFQQPIFDQEKHMWETKISGAATW